VEVVAYTLFTDGVMRPVYEDERGQYVIDDDECKVRGVWYIPHEECILPIIVKASEASLPRLTP
jgi:hypothetical protein